MGPPVSFAPGLHCHGVSEATIGEIYADSPHTPGTAHVQVTDNGCLLWIYELFKLVWECEIFFRRAWAFCGTSGSANEAHTPKARGMDEGPGPRVVQTKGGPLEPWIFEVIKQTGSLPIDPIVGAGTWWIVRSGSVVNKANGSFAATGNGRLALGAPDFWTA